MSDWIRERVQDEQDELRTKVQPTESDVSLIRDLWGWKRSSLEGRHSLKVKILEGLQNREYDLLELGVDNLTPLHWAARGQGDVELVQALIRAGHAISPCDYYGNSPLTLSVVEQDPRLETNLPVIQLLLSNSDDQDLLHHPSILGGNQGLWDYAVSFRMEGTAALIRQRFQKADLHILLKNLAAYEVPERLCRILYYQGRAWPEIAAELRSHGTEENLVWHHLSFLGAWPKYLDELKARGVPDLEAIQALRSIRATWLDVAWAYQKLGIPPEEIIAIVSPGVRAEGGDSSVLASLVAGAIPPEGEDDLSLVRRLLVELGEEPGEVVNRMPFGHARKESVLTRMGMPPKERPLPDVRTEISK